jgi:prepilin-type N-terminal cleavage/methylation domain-containing protein
LRRRYQHGFTLVELLVVVSVIALLAVFAIPRAYTAFNSAKQARVAKELKTIHDAVELHYAVHNYYPVKLDDLITRGYIKPGTNFKSPVSGYWYFYAVDDNRNTDEFRAHAYVLGAPGRDAGEENDLYHSRPLPKGRRPDWRAFAWLYYSGAQGLNLYAAGDVGTPIDTDLPANLSDYRTSCQPGSATICDVWAN